MRPAGAIVALAATVALVVLASCSSPTPTPTPTLTPSPTRAAAPPATAVPSGQGADISRAARHSLGRPDAPVVVVDVFDFQ